MSVAKPDRAFQDGFIARAANVCHRFLVLGFHLALFAFPVVAVWALLTPSAANIPLFCAAALPVAPGLSSALYALRAWSSKELDEDPVRSLWRGARLNSVDVLRWWVPLLAALGVTTTVAVGSVSVTGGALLGPIALVLSVALVLWGAHLLVVSSYFSFRLRDAMRIAAAEAFLQWGASLGILCLLFVAAATVVWGSELALVLFAWAFAAALHLLVRPVVADIEKRFTAHE